MHRAVLISMLALAGFAGLPAATPALGAEPSSDEPWVRDAKVANLRALSKRVTLDVTDQPVEDIFRFIAEVTGADLEPIYLNDDTFEGIDPETTLTIKASEVPGLTLLERVLARCEAKERPSSGYTWQFTDTGSIELGPKSVMNKTQTTELYDISELMFVIPNFDNAPQFDLSSSLQNSGGGGGGNSPFQSAQDEEDDLKLEDRVRRVIDILQGNVEPEEWTAAGGTGASITTYGTSLVVTAPDYVHRQIAGYSFWPSRLQQQRPGGVRILPDARRP